MYKGNKQDIGNPKEGKERGQEGKVGKDVKMQLEIKLANMLFLRVLFLVYVLLLWQDLGPCTHTWLSGQALECSRCHISDKDMAKWRFPDQNNVNSNKSKGNCLHPNDSATSGEGNTLQKVPQVIRMSKPSEDI